MLQLAALLPPNHVLPNGLTASSVILVHDTPFVNTLVPVVSFTPDASFSATLFPVDSAASTPVLSGTGGVGGLDFLLSSTDGIFLAF